jgi:hypothetical protein
MKCSKPGCLRRATRAPVLCVPRKGIPLQLQEPIKATIDIPLCERHIGEPTVRDMLTPAMQRLFVARCTATNSNPPDFDQAFMESCLMTDVRYLDVVKQKGAKGLIQ